MIKTVMRTNQTTLIRRFIAQVIRISFLSIIFAVAVSVLMRLVSDVWSRSRITTLEDAPEKQAALIFGARVYRNGRPSAMLADRIATGVDLYHAGKVDTLIMTGDGRSYDYNEPEAMRKYAISLGVPDEAILIDPYGLRTYDSCYRADEVFRLTNAIVVTQDFHVDRALLTCHGLGIDAVGISADYQRPTGYSRYSLTYSQIREVPATIGALLDILVKAEPQISN